MSHKHFGIHKPHASQNRNGAHRQIASHGEFGCQISDASQLFPENHGPCAFSHPRREAH